MSAAGDGLTEPNLYFRHGRKYKQIPNSPPEPDISLDTKTMSSFFLQKLLFATVFPYDLTTIGSVAILPNHHRAHFAIQFNERSPGCAYGANTQPSPVLSLTLKFDTLRECLLPHNTPHLINISKRVEILIIVVVKGSFQGHTVHAICFRNKSEHFSYP